MIARRFLAFVLLGVAGAFRTANAQSVGELHLRRLLAVPLGALPPMGMLMPASRNHNYWVGRFQAGTQWDNVAGDLAAYAAGVDLQWRGGSTFGLTAGYQVADCEEDVIGCESHALFGARGRFNLITGGPTLAALIGDNSATTTLGGEIGFGYAPNALAGRNACAIDLGMPVSLSLFQRIRVLSFLTPGVAWDVRCPVNGTVGTAASAYLGAGVGVQQIGHPGLDISVGAQRIFRRNSGIQVGLNVSFVWLP
jgi:hypothetical protein